MLRHRSIHLLLAALLLVPLVLTAAKPPYTQVPRTIRISGTLEDLSTRTVPSEETVRFTLYQDQEGTIPLWSETQTVVVAPLGRYTALLGTATEGGIPLPLFTSMDAHWLGVQLEGSHEQPPVMLVSVPYALKAADAETLGGLPASSFVRIEETGGEAPQVAGEADREARAAPNKALVPITGLGVADYLARFTSASTLRPSQIFDNGTYIGVKTASPRTDFHVNGTVAAKRLTLLEGSTSSPQTWSLDNSDSRFRLFYEPYINGGGSEILTATANTVEVNAGLHVTGSLWVQGDNITARFLYADERTWTPQLNTHKITFPGVLSMNAPFISVDSQGSALSIDYNQFMPGSIYLPYRLLTLTSGGMGVFTANPRNNLDVPGEIIATSRLLLARDTSETSQAWHIVNDSALFRLAHQPSLVPHGTVGTTVLVATESNRVGIGVDAPTHTLEVGGDVAIVGAGHRLVFPDGTVQTSATPAGPAFGICISNSAGPQTCACPRLLSQTQISAGQSCTIAGLPSGCTATSQLGPPVTYGACCICN